MSVFQKRAGVGFLSGRQAAGASDGLRRLIGILAVLLVCTPGAGFAQAGRFDVTYSRILGDRDSFGRVIHLFGDSIFRGWALRRPPDEFSAEEARREPLWALRSPASMLNLFLGESGYRMRLDEHGEVAAAEVAAAYAGAAGQPREATAKAVAVGIAQAIEHGTIRPGDIVAFEDAGGHLRDPDGYQKNWETVRAAASAIDVTIVFMDMFDYIPVEEWGGRPADDYRFDARFPSAISPPLRSHNEATRAAASAAIGGAARTLMLPLDARMDGFRQRMESRFGVAVMHSDGVHPNIWGQCLIAGAIARVAGIELRLSERGALAALVRRNFDRLGYGSRSVRWTADAAVASALECASGADGRD